MLVKFYFSLQIYSEYVNLSNTLQNEKAENERLKTYITEIIRVIIVLVLVFLIINLSY